MLGFFLGSRARNGVALLWMVGSALTASAQNIPKTSGMITSTRWVWLFENKERALLEAQLQARPDLATALLADDFVQRSALAPTLPLGREEWLADWRRNAVKGATVSQMAVHEHGPLAIASFWLGPVRGRKIFIVDVWRQREGEDNYELVTRYLSEVAGRAVVRKGAAPAPAASGQR